ncbi:MAG: TrkH family potassium uptake protein [Wenzhouxiangellaceae bacterium]|nr:TrkH family potassium uptake protein [Wenzhouxiangellaceae bacterium]
MRALIPLRQITLNLPPTAVLALLYALLILAGAALLTTSWATNATLGWADAIFTATSAVTVTGLVVVETGNHFTLAGQAVIMGLIQLGGLGIMTFAVLALSMLGQPIGLTEQNFLRNELGQTSFANLIPLVRIILAVMLACELVGTAALAFVFVPEFGWAAGLWQALFHSVSAFNNAGFGLFPDSLSRWAAHPVVNLAVPLLFIIGGLGFSVLYDLYRDWHWTRLSLHSRLLLTGTAALLLFSVPAFALLEWSNPQTLGQFASATDRLMISWFQAVTTRTAGFNTIDIGATGESTSVLLIALMFIGGGSTSTAGGIKVTTFVVLLLAVIAYFRQHGDLVVFGRSLGPAEVMKVLALAVISMVLLVLSIFLITLSNDGDFLDLVFEVVSAFGTVGLSRGATAEVDGLGKGVLIALMFIGRIGPLALGFFLATRVQPRLRYPAGQVYLG